MNSIISLITPHHSPTETHTTSFLALFFPKYSRIPMIAFSKYSTFIYSEIVIFPHRLALRRLSVDLQIRRSPILSLPIHALFRDFSYS